MRSIGKVDAACPARVTVEVTGMAPSPGVLAFPVENALVEMSRDALPVVRGAGASTLDLSENDTRSSPVFAGTGMHSYAVTMTAILTGADGEALSKVATTTAIVGINPGDAARADALRAARLLYAAVVEDVAKRAVAAE